jgi:hypothetical protein
LFGETLGKPIDVMPKDENNQLTLVLRKQMMTSTLRYITRFIVLTILLSVIGCTTTEKTSEWRDQAYAGGNIENILVIGVSNRVSVRHMVESIMVAELEKLNVSATPGYTIMDVDTKIDHATVKAAIADKNFDAVLVTHLVGVEKKQQYVPPTPSINPGYYGYYSMAYGRVYEPGYYEQYEVVKLETSLYDVKSDKLVWSMGSDSIESGSNEKLINANVKIVIESLDKQNLL